jgi:hypothetical protein
MNTRDREGVMGVSVGEFVGRLLVSVVGISFALLGVVLVVWVLLTLGAPLALAVWAGATLAVPNLLWITILLVFPFAGRVQ